MNKIINIILMYTVWIIGLEAVTPIGQSIAEPSTKKSVIIYTIKGNAEEKYNKMMKQELSSIGFLIPDPRTRVNKVYEKKYGKTVFDGLSFMTIVDKKMIKPLLNIDPTIAAFNPFNLLMYKYKYKDKDETIISHLTTDAVFAMLGTTNQEVKDVYIKSMKKIDALILKNFPDAKISYKTYKKLAIDTMMNFEYEFTRPERLVDFIDEIQEKIEDTFVNKGYVMAGFFNFKEAFDGSDLLPQMDDFWTFSLCHFKYSYEMFDNAGARPDAAVFAPCTIYMYIQKNSNKLILGMPRLQNWISMFNITDKARIEYNQKLDINIVEIFKSMGMKEVESTIFIPIKL